MKVRAVLSSTVKSRPEPDSSADLGGLFARRFRQARERAGLTQEQIAAHAGIDEMTASARMSQYENGRHLPRFQIAVRLAEALSVPVEFLYTPDDLTAELLLLWHTLPDSRKRQAIARLRDQ